MPSFDIVSKIDLNEVENALGNMRREIEQRYDFKGSQCSIELEDHSLTIKADDELKLRQMHEILQGHMQKRNIAPGVLDYKTPEAAAGQSQRQVVVLKEGIDKELAKKLVKEIKSSKIKVQVSIQGDELRVSGKKRDDLQGVITLVKGLGEEQPFQFVNMRD